MRRADDALGVEAMSLYRYVPSKAALLDGLYEAVLAELPAPPPAKHVGSVLRERLTGASLDASCSPSRVAALRVTPCRTPASIAHVEFVLETLARAGFSRAERSTSCRVIFAFVIGHTLISYSPRAERRDLVSPLRGPSRGGVPACVKRRSRSTVTTPKQSSSSACPHCSQG